MILKGESAEEFIRKADENYEKYKARQKQNLIDMMEADEKLGLYEKPTKFYTIEDIERLRKVNGELVDALEYIVNSNIRLNGILQGKQALANAKTKEG